MIEDAKKAFDSGQSPAPVFFYCARDNAESPRSKPDSIIASIARQLSSPQPGHPLLPPAVAVYKERETEGFASGSLSLDEGRTLIIELAEHYPLTTIVIDALDECDPENRADLLETLDLILEESASLVKIFVSSRDDHDLVLHLQDYPNLELSSDKNNDDISSFVTAETQSFIKRKKLLALSNNKKKLTTEIIEQVTEKADGMSVLSRSASHVLSLMRSTGSGGPVCNYKACAGFGLMKPFGSALDACHQSWKNFILNYTRR